MKCLNFQHNKKFVEYKQEHEWWLHDAIRHQALSAAPRRNEMAILPPGTMPGFQSGNGERHKVQSHMTAEFIPLKVHTLCNL